MKKIHRFVTEIEENRIIDPEIIHQVRRVLKLAPNEEIIISSGNGVDKKAKIDKIGSTEITLKNIEEVTPVIPEKEITLYCAILKKENFEFVCQKTTEIGIKKIVPIITERTIKQNIRTDRLEKIIKEASEQAGLSRIPTLAPLIKFPEALMESIRTNESTVLFDQEGEKIQSNGRKIGIFIGPEGGFTPEEIVFAKKEGVLIQSLGITTLRGETAAIVASFFALQ